MGGDPAGRPAVVTFDCLGDWHGRPDHPGFGGDFFLKEGVPAVHVLPSGNHWYHYATTAAALAAARDAVAGASRIVTYGSSMGGYAAIRFAGALGSATALALSPQYSIDPARVPFERRWPQEGRSIRWRAELDGPIAGPRPILVYDPRGPDARHARLIARDVEADRIRLPWGAHPVGTILLDTGLLQPLVRAVLADTLDAAAFERQARPLLPGSAVWWLERARQQPFWLAVRAVRFARRAVALAPDDPLALHVLATSLDRAGRHAAAQPLHERVAAMTGRDPGFLRPYSFSRAAAGDLRHAIALAQEVRAADPAVARSHHWEAWLLGRAGDRAAALASLAQAATLDPANPAYPPLANALARGAGLRRHRPHRR